MSPYKYQRQVIMQPKLKIQNLLQLQAHITEEEWLLVDVLRQIILDHIPVYCKEKISYNVPYFYGKKGIVIIWPASIPRGGIQSGVLLGFWQGYLLEDVDNYLTHGTNKKIFYRIYQSVEEIDEVVIGKLLVEAAALDASFP